MRVPSKADGFCLQAHRLKVQWYPWNPQIHGKEVILWMRAGNTEIWPFAKQVHFPSPSSLLYLIQLLPFWDSESWLLVPAAKLFYQKRGKNAFGQNISCKTSIVISFMPSGSCQKCWEYSSRRGGWKQNSFIRKQGKPFSFSPFMHHPWMSFLGIAVIKLLLSTTERNVLTMNTFD